MRSVILCLIILVLSCGVTSAQSFHVEASRNAIVRDMPRIDAAELMRLERGDVLNLVSPGQTERYYNVVLPDGGVGWVSRYVVRVKEGPVEDETVEEVVARVAPPASVEDNVHLAVGRPLGYEVLENKGFVVGYNAQLKIPAWVQYRLTKEQSEIEVLERTNSFNEDLALPSSARAIEADYDVVRPEYVAGHMAPARDMLWSVQAEAESNLFSNIAPQIGTGYNGSVWVRIEHGVRRWVKVREDLTIITGPVFEARPHVQPLGRQPETDRQMLYNVVGQNDVAVPTGFFKIIVDMRNLDSPDVLAFMVPHFETVDSHEREIDQYLCSVDEIEAMTGLDFLTGLPSAVQEDVEALVAQGSW